MSDRAAAGARRAAWLLSGLALLAGCSSHSSVDCPSNDVVCPAPAPSYATDIGPLVTTYCTRCHNPDGIEPTPLLRNYDDVTAKGQLGHVLSQLSSCPPKMPPADQPQPSDDERRLFLSWFACCAASDAGVCPR